MQSRAREHVVAKIVTPAVSSPVVAIVESGQQLYNEAALESQNEDAAVADTPDIAMATLFNMYVRNV
jgi:hypothetical protein